jgi:rod shape-determining protein MreD
MKQKIQVATLFIFSALLQQSHAPLFLCHGVRLPLITAALLYVLFRCPLQDSWTWALLAAFFHDSLTPTFGPALLAYPLIAKLILTYRQDLFRDSIVTQVICGALSSLILFGASIIVYSIADTRPLDRLLIRGCISTILGAICFPFLCACIQPFTTFFNRRRRL